MTDGKPPDKTTFIDTRCALCAGGRDVELFPARLDEESFTSYAFSARRERKREHYRIVRCESCGLVRSCPILDPDEINRLYEKSHFIFSDEAPYAADTYAKLLTYLTEKYGIKKRALLELGCSTGFFLEKAITTGFEDVVGFEPSGECRDHASESIKKRIITDIYKPDALGDRKFDVACCFQVVDHLGDPLGTLESLSTVLTPRGCALFVCHDVESWSARLLGESSPVFDVEHIFLFSIKTVSALFEKAGYDVLETGSLANAYPLAYWMRMLPVAKDIARLLPDFVKRAPVSLKAGNLYILGRKKDNV